MYTVAAFVLASALRTSSIVGSRQPEPVVVRVADTFGLLLMLLPLLLHTQDITQVFPESGTGPRGMADKFSVPYLGKVPLDPRILDCCEAGVPYVVRYPEAPAAPAFRNVVKQVLEATREEDGPYDMTYGGCDIMEEDDAAEGETSTSKQVSKNTVKEGVQSTELRIKSELLTKLRSEAATLTPEMRNAFEALLAKV